MEQGIHLGRGELGHSLGSLRHGVLGKLTWEHQAHGGLDLAGGQGWLLVHAGQLQHTFTTRIVRVGQSGANPVQSITQHTNDHANAPERPGRQSSQTGRR